MEFVKGTIPRNVWSDNTNRKKEERMMKKLIGFFKDEEGATAVEYALFVALIAAIIVSVVAIIGQKSKAGFDKVNAELP